MHLKLNRFLTTDKSTIGTLHIDGVFECYTLEDPYHETKIPGETRIPEGLYTVGLRTVGGFHQRYSKKFSPHHNGGMLQVQDVKGFEYILMHIGNWPGDTEGCVLVGWKAGRDYIYESTNAYLAFYNKVYAVLADGHKVTLAIN